MKMKMIKVHLRVFKGRLAPREQKNNKHNN